VAIWTFLPLLWWHFLTLCAAGPLACYRFYPSGQVANNLSSQGLHDAQVSLPSRTGEASHGRTAPYCHTKGEAKKAFPLHPHEQGEDKMCCDLAGERYITAKSLSPEVERPLIKGEVLPLAPLVSLPEPERSCLGTLLHPTHAPPIYLLNSALLI
jgi:hypothetical protein